MPGHPIAGTEQSGPDAGFAGLFRNRWTILTPAVSTDPAYQAAVERLTAFWQALGSNVEVMDEVHHDLVLAVTSHLPHLIAYNIVGTAADLEAVTRSEVMKYSAGGFRDFTRIAASDPVMWRDIFVNNRDAVLEVLSRFTEDLQCLADAIARSDGEALEALFTRTRDIRRGIIDAGQETARRQLRPRSAGRAEPGVRRPPPSAHRSSGAILADRCRPFPSQIAGSPSRCATRSLPYLYHHANTTAHWYNGAAVSHVRSSDLQTGDRPARRRCGMSAYPARLTIALQKSGRLAQPSLDLVRDAGLRFVKGHNELLYRVENYPIDLLRVRDDDIPTLVSGRRRRPRRRRPERAGGAERQRTTGPRR